MHLIHFLLLIVWILALFSGGWCYQSPLLPVLKPASSVILVVSIREVGHRIHSNRFILIAVEILLLIVCVLFHYLAVLSVRILIGLLLGNLPIDTLTGRCCSLVELDVVEFYLANV